MSVRYYEKAVAWVRYYWFDFGNFAEIKAGETITNTPTVTVSPSGLTLGPPAVVGTTVQVLVSGGTATIGYVLTATIQTSGGATLSQQGGLNVV